MNLISANPIIYVAQTFLDKFRDMMPQNIFSTVRSGRKKVHLVVISGLDSIALAVVS